MIKSILRNCCSTLYFSYELKTRKIMKLLLLMFVMFCGACITNAFARGILDSRKSSLSAHHEARTLEEFYRTPLHTVNGHTATTDIQASEILIDGKKGIAAPTMCTRASSVTVSVPVWVPIIPKPVLKSLKKMGILPHLDKSAQFFNVMMLPMGKNHAFYLHSYVFPKAPDMLFEGSAKARISILNDRGRCLKAWNGVIRTDIESDGWTGVPTHDRGGGISLPWLDLNSVKERGFYAVAKVNKKWTLSYFFLGNWVPGNFKTVRDVLNVKWHENAYFNRAAHNFGAMMGDVNPKYKAVYASLPGSIKKINDQIAQHKKAIAAEAAYKKRKAEALKNKKASQQSAGTKKKRKRIF